MVLARPHLETEMAGVGQKLDDSKMVGLVTLRRHPLLENIVVLLQL